MFGFGRDKNKQRGGIQQSGHPVWTSSIIHFTGLHQFKNSSAHWMKISGCVNLAAIFLNVNILVHLFQIPMKTAFPQLHGSLASWCHRSCKNLNSSSSSSTDNPAGSASKINLLTSSPRVVTKKWGASVWLKMPPNGTERSAAICGVWMMQDALLRNFISAAFFFFCFS